MRLIMGSLLSHSLRRSLYGLLLRRGMTDKQASPYKKEMHCLWITNSPICHTDD